MRLPTTARTDVSEGELKLRELDRRETRWHLFKLGVLLLIVGINLLTLARLQNSINQNQQGAVEARKTNAQRQLQSQVYIKCILLIRYDNPGLNQDSPRADVAAALDRCAAENQ